jgi:hypothetical protein
LGPPGATFFVAVVSCNCPEFLGMKCLEFEAVNVMLLWFHSISYVIYYYAQHVVGTFNLVDGEKHEYTGVGRIFPSWPAVGLRD